MTHAATTLTCSAALSARIWWMGSIEEVPNCNVPEQKSFLPHEV